MNDNEIIKELEAACKWLTEHGRNTNTAIIGICDRATELINCQKEEIERLKADVEWWKKSCKEVRQLVQDWSVVCDKWQAYAYDLREQLRRERNR